MKAWMDVAAIAALAAVLTVSGTAMARDARQLVPIRPDPGSPQRVAGSVLLGCRLDDDHVRIEVHDTGARMSPDEVDRVLKPYQKGETGGTGLGLAVVARLTREQGFAFDVTSTPGRGSAFSVSVPRGAADAG